MHFCEYEPVKQERGPRHPIGTMTTNLSLTPNDCDWLRKVRAAGGAAITDDGREALLEQDMRDPEQR